MQPLVLATGEAGIEYNPHRLGMTDHALTKEVVLFAFKLPLYWYLDRAMDSVQSTASNSPNGCDHEMPLVLAGNPNSNRGNKVINNHSGCMGLDPQSLGKSARDSGPLRVDPGPATAPPNQPIPAEARGPEAPPPEIHKNVRRRGPEERGPCLTWNFQVGGEDHAYY